MLVQVSPRTRDYKASLILDTSEKNVTDKKTRFTRQSFCDVKLQTFRYRQTGWCRVETSTGRTGHQRGTKLYLEENK